MVYMGNWLGLSYVLELHYDRSLELLYYYLRLPSPTGMYAIAAIVIAVVRGGLSGFDISSMSAITYQHKIISLLLQPGGCQVFKWLRFNAQDRDLACNGVSWRQWQEARGLVLWFPVSSLIYDSSLQTGSVIWQVGILYICPDLVSICDRLHRIT